MKRIIFVVIISCLILIPIAGQVQAQWFLFQNPLLGKAAQEFSLPDPAGNVKSLSDLRGGKAAVIFFWATWCPHCRSHLAKMNQQAEEILAKDIRIILVDLGEEAQQVKRYLDQNSIQFQSLLDKQGEVANLYGVQGIPTYVLIDSEGTVKAVEHELPADYAEILQM